MRNLLNLSYRNFTLWRCEDPNYENRIIRNDAVQELCTKYSITPKQVLNKIKSLRSYVHKEHTKVSKKKSGSATSEAYKSSWFAYTSTLLILDGDTQRSGTETELAEYDSQEGTSENEGNRKIEILEHETTSSSTSQQGLDFATPSSKLNAKKKIGAETEFKINKILFEAEMQSLNKQSSYPTIVRSIDTLQPDNSRPGSSIANYSYECSNSTTPEMLSPNSEKLNKWPNCPTMVRSSDTQLGNSCTGSSTTNSRCELSNILSLIQKCFQTILLRHPTRILR
ncbi:unnamed protein product [Acanthoscelides obtectus]|uniref:MADF domain-containing protein n=1 Tax=Acanthoscelides obtectus TaxID=200917 RepID=A0A9P0PFH9_ACAOB|nr:unnamed protein product [Acanthoscelides obtectus]CAK1657340.1 hypothetical protein AOBTE_LOCUS20294 [Acanthoscelides obtectus]